MPDLVAIALPGGPAFVDALRRVWDGGDAALPVDARLAAPARAALLAAMRPARVVGADGARPCPHPRPVAAGDALVVATSGSTGTPKGVVLTHAAVAASAAAGSSRLGADPAHDRWLACLPLAHLSGLGVVTRALLTGVPVEVHPAFDAAAVDAAAEQGATLTTLVPTALSRVHLDRFRAVVVGGADVPPDLPANAVESYGLTETCGGCVYDGAPFEGVEVRVVDGEVHVRGAVLLRCYRDGTDPRDGDGWLHTGDAGRIDAGGRLVIDGRLSDLIITGGENVWPAPVEDVIRGDPAVADVAVIGRRDPEWGERVVAVVEVAPGSDPPPLERLRARVRDRIAAYAAPKQVVVVDALPRTASGKVARARLRGIDLPEP